MMNRTLISMAVIMLVSVPWITAAPPKDARKQQHHGHMHHHGKKDHGHHHMDIQKGPDGLMALPPELIALSERRKKDQATRFSTIKVPVQQARYEVDFWSRQLSEHALFLHLGLEETALKNKALALHKKFEQFRSALKDDTLATILPLCKELRTFKEEVLANLTAGKWIGWIFPLFARHILLELDYFVDKLNGIAYSDREEVVFWDVINCEHAGFAAHLLDPSERELSRKGNRISRKLERVVRTEKEMMVQISLKSAKQLDEYNKQAQTGIASNTVKSVIHPVLIDHVIREGQRSIEMLQMVADKQGR